MKIVRITPTLGLFWLLTACVTINIYFPAAEAQEAAEQIVEDILSGTAEEVPAGQPQSGLVPAPAIQLVGRMLDFLVPPAHAASPNFSVDTPEIRKLQASMKRRHGSLKGFYDSGAIGFTGDALVAVRDASKVGLKQRTQLNKLVAAENADRNAMYKAIAKANGHPEWEPDVRKTFARTWIEQAASGWWFQNAAGKWQQK
jgi:uncharacterized protein YdbL (DUF1318 family)